MYIIILRISANLPVVFRVKENIHTLVRRDLKGDYSRKAEPMKGKFYLAGVLLVITGLLHLAALIVSPLDTLSILPGVFSLVMGTAYIVLGFMLLRLKDNQLSNTALVVLFGLIVDIGRNSSGAEGLALATMVVEALALAVTAYLYFQSRAPLSRVQ